MKLTWMISAAVFAGLLSGSTGFAADDDEAFRKFNAQTYFRGEAPVPERLAPSGMPTRPAEEYTPNMMLEPLSAEAKLKMMQTVMQTNPFSLRDMMNMMVVKKKALPGLTFDEVVESLNSRALNLNMRPVGHTTPWLILRETYDPASPRLEFFSYCDLITMRKILDYSPEFSAFLPCRITVLEDAEGQIWITSLDWDVRWLDTSPNPNRMSDELRERAIKVRDNIEEMMQAAANGDL